MESNGGKNEFAGSYVRRVVLDCVTEREQGRSEESEEGMVRRER